MTRSHRSIACTLALLAAVAVLPRPGALGSIPRGTLPPAPAILLLAAVWLTLQTLQRRRHASLILRRVLDRRDAPRTSSGPGRVR